MTSQPNALGHPHSPHFWRNHLVIPLICFAVLAVAFEWGGLDATLADTIYALEGNRWALRGHFITSILIHKVGKHLSLLIALIVLGGLIASFIKPSLRHWRRPSTYLLVAAGGGSTLISGLKAITHVSCPWDFSRYGGDREYISVFNELFIRTGDDCFPAGHASGGYAWLAFYFLGVYYHTAKRWWGLIIPLSVGVIFGTSQQLRGAHFISHDLWTLGICWFFSLLCYRLILQNKPSA